MNNHSRFSKRCSKKRLSSSKKSLLRKKRNIIREKIRVHFSNTKRCIPKFKGQGSYAMRTTINPISGEYDIDDGIYLTNIDTNKPISEWEKAETVHSWVFNAVKEHTDEVKDKSRCVRVIYVGDYHVDFPIYAIKNNVSYIAEKGEKQWHKSDPKAVVDWFNEREQHKKSRLERLVIYLKVWKDYRKDNNKSITIVDGFQLTVLAEKYFYDSNDDEEMFFKTVENIYFNLDKHPPLFNPVDTSVDILEKYSDAKISSFKEEFSGLYTNSKAAYEEKDEFDSAQLWQKVFGDELQSPKSSDVSHQEAPRWQVVQQYQVSVTGKFAKSNKNLKYFTCDDVLPKNCELRFWAETNTSKPFDVYWQVVNTGDEARKADGLRGEIFSAKTAGAGGLNLSHNESTLYKGTHWIECFIVKQSICVARSGKFLVRIA